MARKLSLEYPGACYHVINRGNYRSVIFKTEEAKLAFEACLFEACAKSNWVLHAYVLMSNHYHLALDINPIPPIPRVRSNSIIQFPVIRDKAFARVPGLKVIGY